MKHKLIPVALIAILLCMFLGNSIACGPTTTKYDLTINSTEGGSVTTPGEATFTYDEGEVVDLVATPDAGYHFVNWTGDVGAVADVNDATTTITMNDDYTITANFALGAVTYDLTISSTDGGDVTAPGEGTFPYDAGTVVNLVATPDDNCRFVNWTGDVGTIANVNDATTIITMNNDYTITANFALNMTFINNVPDTNQLPTQTLPSTASDTNYCAPMAMVNILYYWDVVMGHATATDVTDDLPLSAANTTAEYLGYFMDTNNNGSKARGNDDDMHSGTYAKDIGPGTEEFVRWDATHNFTTFPPPFSLPTGKLGYDWTVTSNYVTSDTFADAAYNESVAFYTAEIDAGRPLVVSFRYWNPVPTGISLYDPETGETIDVFTWGDEVQSSSEANTTNPYEEWNWQYVEDNREECIGHAVTGVGYSFVWAADGSGPYLEVIVHDNWPNTPKNIAILWKNWNSCHAVNPGS